MTAQNWIAIIVAVLSSSLLVKVIDTITASVSKKKNKNDKHTRAMQMLMLKTLRDDGRCYLHKNGIDEEELKSYMEAYSIYKELGGNGYADKLYKQVCDLPISED